MSPAVVAVDPAGAGTLAARLLAAAGRPGCSVVVVADPSGASVPAPDHERLTDVLGGDLGVGAVLPGPPCPPGAGPSPGFADSPDGAGPAVAVTPTVINRAALDPALDDPGEVIGRLVSAARALRLRVVRDPAWPMAGPPGPAGAPPDPAPAGLAVLVVTAPLDDEWLRSDDRAAGRLIESLATLAGPVPVTVMTTERIGPAARDRWAAAGLAVLEGPEAWDPESPAAAPEFAYSHVVVTAAAARSSVRAWVESTQPMPPASCTCRRWPSATCPG